MSHLCCETGKKTDSVYRIFITGGEKPFNLIPVHEELRKFICDHGLKRSSDIFPGVKKWLEDNGWHWDKNISSFVRDTY